MNEYPGRNAAGAQSGGSYLDGAIVAGSANGVIDVPMTSASHAVRGESQNGCVAGDKGERSCNVVPGISLPRFAETEDAAQHDRGIAAGAQVDSAGKNGGAGLGPAATATEAP